jgi:RNA polymerase I-specific transcription initiation factor RRN5
MSSGSEEDVVNGSDSTTEETEDDKKQPSDARQPERSKAKDETETSDRSSLRSVSTDPATPSRGRQSSGLRSRPLLRRKGDWRLRTLYNDAYRVLLNEEIEDARWGLLSGDAEGHFDSTIGVSEWTGVEKETFFDAVARFGRDDLPRISAAIGKSQPEIRQYMLLLEQGIRELAGIGTETVVLGIENVPAAATISEECCEQLEQAADALANLQLRAEARKEEQKYGNLWLVTRNFAERCDQSNGKSSYEEGFSASSEEDASAAGKTSHAPSRNGDNPLKAMPSAEFFNVKNFLELSERIYMNAEDDEANWQSYVDDGQGVSIFRTAFDDLHTLAVSLTRRLLYAAHFQAMSRVRATSKPEENQSPTIQQRDVEIAADMVGLPAGSHEYWASLPRRLGFSCYYQKVNRSDRKKHDVSYEDAEKYLRQPIEKSESFTKVGDGFIINALESIELNGESESSEEDVEDESISDDENSPAQEEIDADMDTELDDQSRPSSQSNKRPLRHDVDTDEEAGCYLEALDHEFSKAEERQLWSMLEHPVPETLYLEPVDVTEPSDWERFHEEPETDWRELIQYSPDWEHRPHAFLEKATARKRQRQSSSRSRSASPSNSVSQGRSRSKSTARTTKKPKKRSRANSKSGLRARSKTHDNQVVDDKRNEDESESGLSPRASLPRRASQVAMQSLEQSLEERMQFDGEVTSGEEFDPRSHG